MVILILVVYMRRQVERLVFMELVEMLEVLQAEQVIMEIRPQVQMELNMIVLMAQVVVQVEPQLLRWTAQGPKES